MRSADIEHLERAKTGERSALEIFWHGALGAPPAAKHVTLGAFCTGL
jgi:hypothetical protein